LPLLQTGIAQGGSNCRFFRVAAKTGGPCDGATAMTQERRPAVAVRRIANGAGLPPPMGSQKGLVMNKFAMPAMFALAMPAFAMSAAGPALAADIAKPVYKAAAPAPAAPVWDVAFGGVITSDYNFRGVSQSNRGPSGGAYMEFQFTPGSYGTWYAGIAAMAIDWPGVTVTAVSSADYGLTNPSAEIDFYGGWRNTWGPLSLDLGFWYYYYPKEIWNGFTGNSDFWEVYAKLAYNITPDFTLGANLFYTPHLLNYSETFNTLALAGTGITGDARAFYLSGTFKWVTPWKHGDLGLYFSGELGHWFIEDAPFVAAGALGGSGIGDPSYTYYNIGAAFTYKALTLDLRYHGTDMNALECASFLVSAVPNSTNRWCGDTFIVSGKFDTTLNALK
jgi:uncharacterized protein (TIGR02001 family)